MSPTGIEWVLNPDGSRGITLNSKTGCLNHTPEGLCLGGLFPCYAYKLANGRLKGKYLNHVSLGYSFDELCQIPIKELESHQSDPFYPRFWPERLDKIRAIKKPTGIFLDDMSDWMGEYWPEEWTRQELQVMRDCPQHRFYTLTKQPQNLPQWEFPDNCWVGVTATNEKMAWYAMKYLKDIYARVRFISFEPLLGKIPNDSVWPLLASLKNCRINWLIIGACTGAEKEMTELARKYTLTEMPYGNKWTAQPSPDWIKEIVEAADKAGVKVFLKDNLVPLIAGKGTPEGLFYKDIWLRQELPNG